MMDERIENVVRTCHLLMLEAECHARRSQNQSNVVSR